MFALLKFLFFCALAVAAGVFAVSVPVLDKTVAEHVRSFVLERSGEADPPRQKRVAKAAPASEPVAAKPTAVAKRAPAPPPPEDGPTDDERAALDELLGKKLKR